MVLTNTRNLAPTLTITIVELYKEYPQLGSHGRSFLTEGGMHSSLVALPSNMVVVSSATPCTGVMFSAMRVCLPEARCTEQQVENL